MQNTAWASVEESDLAIKIETDKLAAIIPKKNPKHWMTGIEKGSFLDKATGFREIGDGLMVIDWLMEAGSDENYGDQVIAPDGGRCRQILLVRKRDRPGPAVLYAHVSRQQPSQAHGRGTTTLPQNEARPTGRDPQGRFYCGHNHISVRMRRSRSQSRIALDPADCIPQR